MLSKALLLLISALLILVSLPGGGLPLLACIAVAPALIATANLKPVQAGLMLGAWSWFWWCCTLWWASSSLVLFADSSNLTGTLVTALVCFTLALPYAISAFLISHFNLWHSPLRLIQIPLLFAVLIGLFSTVLPAAPVNALFEYPILLQWADVGGLPILVLFYFIFNTAIAAIFVNKKNGLLTTAATLFILPIVVLLYGDYQLTKQDQQPTTLFTIGYIQPVANKQDKLSTLIAQTQTLKQTAEQVDLVIWPEVPVDFSWHDKQYERYRIRKLAQEVNSHLIVLSGYHYANGSDAANGHFNSANFISNNGDSLAEYRKQKLVPFFEYLPFKGYLAPYFPNTRNYIPGQEAVPFQYKSLTLAPLICYEALFTGLVRPYIEQGADIIINPGNDGWFGKSGALGHLSLASLRAIEYRTPVIRVNNSGVSTVINHKGEIQFETLSPLDTKAAKVFTLPIAQAEKTFFYRYGTTLNILSVIVLGLSLPLAKKRKNKKESSS
ncbi:apolipoprotein N-acyltransferase [Alkalimarinus sediminis]|uniref:Apolipoprotein N-acyltransferase n=1 Tax=Alkalimarinus sediminis TaxID=1632866 RepID=A0A9E8KI70_9ALTE|nr:apolipoprotein N-acyltransferase [Alkalimarinus sediminis]UZW73641.1 apolipoprotein N-acyltransferase [Alkalimarinus sediminis]